MLSVGFVDAHKWLDMQILTLVYLAALSKRSKCRDRRDFVRDSTEV
jgi:hypothetical protein